MATTRPRTAGLGVYRRQSQRVYNEPFTPKVEERDENEAHILLLELPDFNQQHVKVKVEKEAGTVVVTGGRNVGNNRLLILNKTYPIPRNSVIDRISHTLQDGVLTITMPKQTAEPATPPAAAAPPTPTPLPKEPEQSTPEKGKEETPSAKSALPEMNGEIKEPEAAALPKDDSSSSNDKGKSAELQKQASAKANEETPTPTPAAAAAERGQVQGDSGKAETTLDRKISSPYQKKPTEKKEIENQNLEKGRESKTEEADKNVGTAKIDAVTPSPRTTRVGKLAGGSTVRRMQLLTTVSLWAAVVIAVAAYFA
ncbi:inactive protein RESTRICTED TEV MOVEMENT 2-like [Cucurbita pepo subsp. pepo]|uniref:inactive protein RESTRICTED TEV MOVEMENT 2-like n=1 Tax=Cucurbita pepo subsp. pepo TaxID=3664 RepID=UPI000C9D5B83|nr:inactive protein RESTRICTED TEV MOVEMENT 2-like [Cucurbita pepo subsp. pepo]